MTVVTVSFPGMGKRSYGTGTLYVGKDGSWWGRWHAADGRRPHRKIGDAKTAGQRDGLTKKQAEEKLRELILADNGAERSAHGAAPTIEQLGAALVARLKRDGKKKSHIETVESHLRAHINPFLGRLPASSITDRDIERLVSSMLDAGRSPKTIHNVVGGTLHALLARAIRDRYIERNPCEMVDLPRVTRSRELRFLNHDELERVLAAAPPLADNEIARHFPVGDKYGGPDAVRAWWPVLRLMVLAAAMTGMRLGELRALRWSDLDWWATKTRVRQNFVRGEFGTPKSDLSARGIPLAGRLVAELEEHHRTTTWNQDHHLVFAHPHTGRPLDRVRLGKHFHAALSRADVRPVRFHDLRHTFATTVAASGKVSMRTLQEWMGHEDIRTTMIYADYFPGDREAELIDEAFAPRPTRGPTGGPILASQAHANPRNSPEGQDADR